MRLLTRTFLPAHLLCCLTCSAQNDEKRADAAHSFVSYINIQPASEKINFHVTGIEIYDSRIDTSCLGVTGAGPRLNSLKLKNPLPEEVKKYYRSLVDTSGDEAIELHCFIKRLILSDYINVKNTEEEKMSSRGYDASSMSGILFMAEFYGKRENLFIPLCRFDTTLTGTKEIYRDGAIYLTHALKTALQKASRFSREKFLTGKGLSRDEVNNFNEQRLNISILHNPPVKGVYLTFKDFLTNTPSARNFTVEKDKKGDFLYLKNENGQDILLTDLWGYCDGKDIFIYSANNYFRLQRTGKGFKIYGAKDFTSQRNLRPNFGLIDMVSPNSVYSKGQTRTKYVLVKKFFLLDMETGELY